MSVKNFKFCPKLFWVEDKPIRFDKISKLKGNKIQILQLLNKTPYKKSGRDP